jgi:hypothetical protein
LQQDPRGTGALRSQLEATARLFDVVFEEGAARFYCARSAMPYAPRLDDRVLRLIIARPEQTLKRGHVEPKIYC